MKALNSVDYKQTLAFVLISYNQQEYIIEALDGIRNQTRCPDQVVIADDGSTDNTPFLIREYVAKYQLEAQWTLLLSAVNRGINANLQNAFDHTTAEIIIAAAGDDVSLPNRCNDTLAIFSAHPDCALVSTSGYVIDEFGTVIRHQLLEDRLFNNLMEAVKHGNPRIPPVGHAYRRAVLYGFEPLPLDLPNEDDQLTFRGLLLGGIMCSSVKTFKYRIHSQSASAWLHKQQTVGAYFERFQADMRVRARHMHYWANALMQSEINNREALVALVGLKQAMLEKLAIVGAAPCAVRLKWVIDFRQVLTLKECIYFVFGRSGVLFWRFVRRSLKRA